MLQGVSRTWLKKEIEQSVDLRLDGIRNDETYADEQYMQRIAEQVQKLQTTEEIFKDDSPKDNILSEKAVKKIHKACNCELYETQQRTHTSQSQRCYSHIEAGFPVCPCGGQRNMSEEMQSSIRQKIKQLITDALRYVVSFSVRSETNGKKTHKKPSRLPSNYTSYPKHEQKQVRFKNQIDVTITARIWTERSSTGIYGSLTISR